MADATWPQPGDSLLDGLREAVSDPSILQGGRARPRRAPWVLFDLDAEIVRCERCGASEGVVVPRDIFGRLDWDFGAVAEDFVGVHAVCKPCPGEAGESP